MPDGEANPLALIQIPYSRLREKHTLTSILHEAGHQALARMRLSRAIGSAFDEALARGGFSASLRKLGALWAGELGPDFWTFCACGAAQASSARELFALPRAHAAKLSWTDPHPPPALRVLAAFDWCREAWGAGRWDDWEREWLDAAMDEFIRDVFLHADTGFENLRWVISKNVEGYRDAIADLMLDAVRRSKDVITEAGMDYAKIERDLQAALRGALISFR
jgi:hypothetical protein